jgi:hypothetical protein
MMRRRIVSVVAVVLLILFLCPPPAAAIPGCEEDLAPTPERASSGLTGLFGTPPGFELRTIGTNDVVERDYYHELGAAGLTWHTIKESCVDGISTAPISGVADVVWMLAKSVALLAIMLYEWAMRGSLAGIFENFTVDAVSALRSGIYAPLLGAVVILGAVWMAWVGLVRKRATLTVEGALWMVAATACGIWVMGSPASVMDAASRVTMGGADLAHAAVAEIDGGSALRCPSTWSADTGSTTTSAREAAVRRQSEALWAGLLCTPWMAGQLGVSEESREWREAIAPYILSTQAISRSAEIEIARGDRTVTEVYESKQLQYIELSERIEGHDQTLYELFAGDYPADRLGVALMALTAAVCVGGMVIAVSVATLAAQFAFLLLLMLAPVFFLLGTHPGRGRVLLLRWAEVCGGILLRQTIWSLLLMLLVQIYASIMSADLAWGRQMILLALLTIAVVLYRKPLLRMVGSVGVSPDPRRIVERVTTVRGDRSGSGGRDGRDGVSGRTAPVRQRSAPPRKRVPKPPTPGAPRKWAGTAARAVATRWPQTAAAVYVVDRIRKESSPAPARGRADPGGSGRRGTAEQAPRLRQREQATPPQQQAQRAPSPQQPVRHTGTEAQRNPRGQGPGRRSPR